MITQRVTFNCQPNDDNGDDGMKVNVLLMSGCYFFVTPCFFFVLLLLVLCHFFKSNLTRLVSFACKNHNDLNLTWKTSSVCMFTRRSSLMTFLNSLSGDVFYSGSCLGNKEVCRCEDE